MEHAAAALQYSPSAEIDYLIISSAHECYALPHHNVIQIVDCPHHTSLPNSLNQARGALDFMGKPVILLDLRKILGKQSLVEDVDELVTTMKARKQDHLNWVKKLKDSVFKDQEITVEQDPHKCAFGRWYDNFKTDSVNLQLFMEKFDKPHKAVHNLSVQGKGMMQKGQKSQAWDLILQAEQRELVTLLRLFDAFETEIKSFTYEYAIVIQSGNEQFALAVDEIRFFDKFDSVIPIIHAAMKISSEPIIDAIGRKEVDGLTEEIPIINCNNLLSF